MSDDVSGRVTADHAEWLEVGVEISCWGVDPRTGVLDIGVRSSVDEASPLLRARYGDGIRVFAADVVPAGGLLGG